jgi:hypothetical protein
LRLAVLSADEPHHAYLVWLLRERGFDVTLWLSEAETHRRRRALRRGRWQDWIAAVYHNYRRRITGLAAYRKGAFALPTPLTEVPSAKVSSLNGSISHRLLVEANPDVTIIIGCTILSPATLALSGHPTVNVHCGYLPDYRGNHCIFFALDAGDHDRIGATIHHVDAGIDTGDIIDIITTDVRPTDIAEHIYCRLERLAFDRLCGWLTHLERGSALPRNPQPNRGHTFKTCDRTPYHDLRSWWRRQHGRNPSAQATAKQRKSRT